MADHPNAAIIRRLYESEDSGPWDIAVTVDGADEVDARLNLIKGGGAAHTRDVRVAVAVEVRGN